MKEKLDLVLATAGAMLGAVVAYWIGLRVGDALAGPSAGAGDTNLVEGLFDFIASLFVIVIVALIAAVLGTGGGVWAALRLGKQSRSGTTGGVALVLGTFVLLGGVPASIAVIEAVGFGDELVVFVAPLVPGVVGYASRWLVNRTEPSGPG